MKYKCYLCNMKTPTAPYEFLASFFLPEGMLDWFELTSVTEESIDESPDRVFKAVLHIYLDERDNRTDETSYLRPNGFTEETTIKDFPARDRKVVLHVRRRRWLDENNSNCIMNVYNLAVSGTRYSEGFAEFLKKKLGYDPSYRKIVRALLHD